MTADIIPVAITLLTILFTGFIISHIIKASIEGHKQHREEEDKNK